MLIKNVRFSLADINMKKLPSNDSNTKNVFLMHFTCSGNVKFSLFIQIRKCVTQFFPIYGAIKNNANKTSFFLRKNRNRKNRKTYCFLKN